jgi:hypothetical protein
VSKLEDVILPDESRFDGSVGSPRGRPTLDRGVVPHLEGVISCEREWGKWLGGNRLPGKNRLMSEQINVRMDRDSRGGLQTRLFHPHLIAYRSELVRACVEQRVEGMEPCTLFIEIFESWDS